MICIYHFQGVLKRKRLQSSNESNNEELAARPKARLLSSESDYMEPLTELPVNEENVRLCYSNVRL